MCFDGNSGGVLNYEPRIQNSRNRRSISPEILIGRILFLEGKSKVSKLNRMHIGNSVEDQLAHDHEAEVGAVANYNAVIQKVNELGDHGTRDLLTTILV
jgi:bacterioferritin (cytochrome b1)